MTAKTDKITKVAPALANGVDARNSANSALSLARSRQPKAEPEVTDAKVKKAIKKAATKKAPAKAKAAPKAKGNRLSLKQNKEVRNLLTQAAQAAGGSRLSPIGFASYTEFLAGVPLDADGNADVVFVPVKGSEPIKGKNVKLTIKGGKVVKVK